MSVFRIEKNKNYTVMSNHHLRNKDLSLKAKGLLSQMLSLPDDWDYTLKGLARINKEKIDAIRTAVLELEKAGYITRKQGRDELGKMAAIEYTIYEQPQPRLENPITEQPILEKPSLENPISDNPITDNPMSENPTQLNIDITNKEKLNTDVIKYPSINQREQMQKIQENRWIDRYNKNTERIKNNIECDALVLNYDKAVIDEIVSVMAEVLTVDTPYYTIEKKQYPTELVRQRFLEIDYGKLDAFLLDFSRRTEKIHNTKAYLITSLFNIPATADTNLSNMVKNDLYGDGGRW
ncbi:MAG: DUF6017 domain-containing protein [bacterium]|nr:DUF6017 domain-containing protein [bacterium]